MGEKRTVKKGKHMGNNGLVHLHFFGMFCAFYSQAKSKKHAESKKHFFFSILFFAFCLSFFFTICFPFILLVFFLDFADLLFGFPFFYIRYIFLGFFKFVDS